MHYDQLSLPHGNTQNSMSLKNRHLITNCIWINTMEDGSWNTYPGFLKPSRNIPVVTVSHNCFEDCILPRELLIALLSKWVPPLHKLVPKTLDQACGINDSFIWIIKQVVLWKACYNSALNSMPHMMIH